MRGLILVMLLSLLGTFFNNAQDDEVPPHDLADPNGAFVEVDGVELYYIAEGDPTNPAVMLLHGFGGSTFTWRDTIPALVEAGYYAVAFDRPPYGLADKDPEIDYSDANYADLTAGLLDALDIDSATMVGHSAGGGVIAQIATAHTERVDALVFVAGAVRVPQDTDTPEATPDPDGENDSALSGLFNMTANLDPESEIAIGLVDTLVTPAFFSGLLSSAYGEDFVVTDEISAGYTRILRVEGWQQAFLNLVTGNPMSDSPDFDALQALDVPVYIMWGEADTWVPLDVGERLGAFFGDNAQTVTYPGIGHLPMEEETAEFNADLIHFLGRVYGE